MSDQSFTTTFAVDQTPTEAFLGSTHQSNTGMIGCCSGRRVGAYPCDALITGRLAPSSVGLPPDRDRWLEVGRLC